MYLGHYYPDDTEKPLDPELPLETFKVKPEKHYRFRIINVAMFVSFRFSIDEVCIKLYYNIKIIIKVILEPKYMLMFLLILQPNYLHQSANHFVFVKKMNQIINMVT